MTLFDKNFDRIESSSDFGLISSFIFCTQQEDPRRHGCTFRITNISLHQNFQSSYISYLFFLFLSETVRIRKPQAMVKNLDGEHSALLAARHARLQGTRGAAVGRFITTFYGR